MTPAAPRTEARPVAPDAKVKRGVIVEVEALIAGVVAALIGGGFAALVFHGKSAAIWADWSLEHWSIGMTSVIAVAVLGTFSAVVGHWRSRRLPGQDWRLELPAWKFTLDAVVVAIVHTALGALATAILMFVVQLAFRRLTIDPVNASISSAVVTGAAAYMLYLAVSRLTTVKLSQRIFLFVGAGLLTSMATSTDPIWWRYQISVLGAFGDRPSISFNAVLIVGGIMVTTFALYVDRDIRNLHDAHVLRYRFSAPSVSALFIAMGIALAGIGSVPVNVSVFVHNIFAISLSAVFGILMIASPFLLRGMPWPFFVATLGLLVVLVIATWLFYGVGYLPLTNYELIAFAVLFVWLSMFVRFLAALLDSGARDAAPLRDRTPTGSIRTVPAVTTHTGAAGEAAPLSEPSGGSGTPQPAASGPARSGDAVDAVDAADAEPAAEQEKASSSERGSATMPLPDDVPPQPPLPDPHDTGLRR